MALEGKLKDISLSSVVQILCLERRSATLFVWEEKQDGAIFFDNGEIVHAHLGNLQGEEAIYQLLTWTEGSFRTDDQPHIKRKTIGMNWNHLLMEGMRRIDERGLVTTEITLSKLELRQDEALESDLITLFSKLERTVATLKEHRVTKQPPLAMEMVANMVNETIDIFDTMTNVNPMEGSLIKLLMKTSDLYPQSRFLQAKYNRISVQTVCSLYKSWNGNTSERQYLFQQLFLSLITILEYYFSLLITHFHAAKLREQWKETYEIFVADLNTVVSTFNG